MTTHVAVAPGFAELIDLWAPVRQIATGFEFTEGPIWHPREQHLLFSDMPGDVRRRWDRRGVAEVMRPSNKCNGMTYDAQGNLYVCEHVTSSVVKETPAGERKVVASHWEGKELNAPNDVVVRSDGSVYFTDPTYGRMPVFGLERKQDLDFQGVFRISTDGKLHREANDFTQPNGLCFSPDEKVLYVNAFTTHFTNFHTPGRVRVGQDANPGAGQLLQYLISQAYIPEYQVRWRWKKNSVAIWDNRSTQHYAVMDYPPCVRRMERAGIVGDVPF